MSIHFSTIGTIFVTRFILFYLDWINWIVQQLSKITYFYKTTSRINQTCLFEKRADKFDFSRWITRKDFQMKRWYILLYVSNNRVKKKEKSVAIPRARVKPENHITKRYRNEIGRLVTIRMFANLRYFAPRHNFQAYWIDKADE